MNKDIKENLDQYEDGDAFTKEMMKQIFTNEDINEFDVRDWERETGRKSTW